MGTLTADLPRLPEYCDHKLPTSCRLSSIPNCCACADERAHQSSYSTYVDGVGFVARGARWDRYCWPCSRTKNLSLTMSHCANYLQSSGETESLKRTSCLPRHASHRSLNSPISSNDGINSIMVTGPSAVLMVPKKESLSWVNA
jgi:hypothetical protein